MPLTKGKDSASRSGHGVHRTEAKYRLTYINGLPMYKSLSSGTDRLLELGTTATLAVLQGRHLLVANVGDSAAVLGRWAVAAPHPATLHAHPIPTEISL